MAKTETSPVITGVVVGIVCGGVAIGVGQLLAGMVNPDASPIVTVGQWAIDASPEWLKSFAIRTFGAHDKIVLLIGIAAVLACFAAVLGIVAVRHVAGGLAGLGLLGLVGVATALSRPTASPVYAVPTIGGTAAAAGALFLFQRSRSNPDSAHKETDRQTAGGVDRRRFFLTSAAGVAAAFAAGGAGNLLARRFRADASRAAVRIPVPGDTRPEPLGVDLHVPGLSSFITPNDTFYRVDTALLAPAVDADGWRLRVHGMVDREVTLTYRQLLERPMIERDVTLTCVSNPVGGRYAGNARWIGTRLTDLLEEAGVAPDADQIVTRSVDGFTAGTPTAITMDGRDAMLAVAMNGEPLPISHGFPVRSIVPGLYGYVSATKWLVDIELTTFDAFDAYWVQRGWAQQAPIKTESRIDTPKQSQTISAGPVSVAGVAWAQHRGIAGVELRVDGGQWMPARLSAQDTTDTWRQWLVVWDATAGTHELQVRATDRTGAVETATERPPFPNGASGYHTVSVQVA